MLFWEKYKISLSDQLKFTRQQLINHMINWSTQLVDAPHEIRYTDFGRH